MSYEIVAAAGLAAYFTFMAAYPVLFFRTWLAEQVDWLREHFGGSDPENEDAAKDHRATAVPFHSCMAVVCWIWLGYALQRWSAEDLQQVNF